MSKRKIKEQDARIFEDVLHRYIIAVLRNHLSSAFEDTANYMKARDEFIDVLTGEKTNAQS